MSVEVALDRRFQLVNTVIQDDGQFQATWTLGGSTYQLGPGSYRIILRDGNPVDVQDWQYTGALTRDGTQIGGVELRPELDGVAAYLTGPDGEVRINRWASA